MLRTNLATVTLAAATLAAAGCGESSKSGSTGTSASTAPATTRATSTTATNAIAPPTQPIKAVNVKIASGKPLTRAAWLAKGDDICARLHAQLGASKIRAVHELPRVLPQVAAYEEAEVTQLAKLVPPPSKAHDWQEILNEILQLAEGSVRIATYARLGSAITRAPLTTQMLALQNHLTSIAKRDGFKECSVA